MATKLIIGLTGKNAAGKGAVAEILKAKGFVYHSLSDIIREEATRRKLDHSRDNLFNIGNELRSTHGAAVLASKTLEKIASDTHPFHVVDSIRSPFEAKELMTNPKFTLIGVDAKDRTRYDRLILRARPGDAQTFEEFVAQEVRENSSNATSQQLDATYALAQRKINNDGLEAELKVKVDELLAQLQSN